MARSVNIAPEVVRGIESFGLQGQTSIRILESVEHNLAEFGDRFASDRWDKCPDDFFVYSHVLIDGGRWHNLVFVVDDTVEEMGILRVLWVEHYPGDFV